MQICVACSIYCNGLVVPPEVEERRTTFASNVNLSGRRMRIEQDPATLSKTSCYSRLWSAATRSKPIVPAADRENSGAGLVRRLGLFDLILIGVGASIGSGIFVITGTVARDAGPGQFVAF